MQVMLHSIVGGLEVSASNSDAPGGDYSLNDPLLASIAKAAAILDLKMSQQVWYILVYIISQVRGGDERMRG